MANTTVETVLDSQVESGVPRDPTVGKLRWCSLVANIMNDVEFLRAHNIMDYSMLLGVATLPAEHWEDGKGRQPGQEHSATGGEDLGADHHTVK